MFISLNKKIILSIVTFFIISFSVLGYTLYNLYNSRLQEDQQILHLRNLQYNELLYHYNILKTNIGLNNVYSPVEKDNTPSKLQKQKDTRYTSLLKHLNIILLNLIIFACLIVLMIIFLHKLVLLPINHFSNIF